VDVRVIAATHRNIPLLVREGRFREDLYYRLNVVTIALPALRERRQDIPLLIDHFLRALAGRHGRGLMAVDPDAQLLLLAHDWPGNIRELQNVLERAVLMAEQDVIGPEHLSPDVLKASSATRQGAGPATPEAPAVLHSLEELEREHVTRVLAAVQGNREEASAILGISRRTLTRMIQRWDLPRR
jgi:DNA-binding NtrC family response regulator